MIVLYIYGSTYCIMVNAKYYSLKCFLTLFFLLDQKLLDGLRVSFHFLDSNC